MLEILTSCLAPRQGPPHYKLVCSCAERSQEYLYISIHVCVYVYTCYICYTYVYYVCVYIYIYTYYVIYIYIYVCLQSGRLGATKKTAARPAWAAAALMRGKSEQSTSWPSL